MAPGANNDQNIDKTLEQVYELFGILRERSDQLGGTLSGGQQQMLAIGRALMSRPRLLMMDEPSLGVAPLGAEGELVLTTITKEGFPLIRYRTGDITRLDPAPCPCGRTSVRMARILGRTDDLILFQCVGFFPAQIEEILAGLEGVSPYFQILLDQERGVETIEIRVEISARIPFLDEVKTIETLRLQAAKRITTALDVEPKVTLVEPKSLRALDPTARVLDKRPG